jgi:uncharacterized protein (DUF58 family)
MIPFMSKQTEGIKRVLGPLSKTEERRAVKVATTHFLKQAGNNARYRMIDVSLRIEKPFGLKQLPSRSVQVVFANYSDRRNVAVLIDAKGKVLQDEVLLYQPSLSEEERAEAREIALRDERVAPIAKRRNVFVSEVSVLDHDVAREARVIGLRYILMQNKQYMHLATAVISITDQRVMSFKESGGEPQK